MRRLFTYLHSVCLAVSCLWAGTVVPVAPAQTISPGQAVQNRTLLSPEPYHLQLSDTVEITFPFSAEYNQTVTIQPDGRIALKEAPAVSALGQSTQDLERAIAAAYRGILHDPEVSVVLKDFQKPSYFASGEVGKPGRYDLRTNTSLLQALAEAGGLLHERAKRTQVVLFRPQLNNMFEVRVIDVKAMLDSRTPIEDYAIHPGDVIYVPQNKFSKVARFIPTANMSAYLAPGGF